MAFPGYVRDVSGESVLQQYIASWGNLLMSKSTISSESESGGPSEAGSILATGLMAFNAEFQSLPSGVAGVRKGDIGSDGEIL